MSGPKRKIRLQTAAKARWALLTWGIMIGLMVAVFVMTSPRRTYLDYLVPGAITLVFVGGLLWDMRSWTWRWRVRRAERALAAGDMERVDRETGILLAQAARRRELDWRRLQILLLVSGIKFKQPRRVEAIALLDEAVEIAWHYAVSDDESVQLFCAVTVLAASDHLNHKEWDRAWTLLTRGLGLLAECSGLEAFELRCHSTLAGLYLDVGDLPQAEAHLMRADAILPHLHPLDALEWKGMQTQLLHYRARWQLAAGDPGHAWRLAEQILPDFAEHYHLTRGECLLARGEFAAAEQAVRAALDAVKVLKPETSPAAIEFLAPLAGSLIGQRKFDEALELQAQIERLFSRNDIPRHHYWLAVLGSLAKLWHAQGRDDQASALEEKLRGTRPTDTAIQAGRKDAIHTTK